jgi:hypothetical protein
MQIEPMAKRLAEEVILPMSQTVGDKAQPMAEEVIARYIDPVADAITQQVRGLSGSTVGCRT